MNQFNQEQIDDPYYKIVKSFTCLADFVNMTQDSVSGKKNGMDKCTCLITK